MSDFIDPAEEQVKSALRRGGPLDTTKYVFTCEQCGNRITMSIRKRMRSRKLEVCPKCGSTAKMKVQVLLDGVLHDPNSNPFPFTKRPDA